MRHEPFDIFKINFDRFSSASLKDSTIIAVSSYQHELMSTVDNDFLIVLGETGKHFQRNVYIKLTILVHQCLGFE